MSVIAFGPLSLVKILAIVAKFNHLQFLPHEP